MDKKITKKEYFTKIVELGINRVGYIPDNVLKDSKLLKSLIACDTNVLMFLPSDFLLNQEHFWHTTRDRNSLVASNITNKHIPAKMLEFILDDNNNILGYPYMRKEFPQFTDFTDDAKTKLALSFLIEGRVVPDYVKDFATQFEFKEKEELMYIKNGLILKDNLKEELDSAVSKSNDVSEDSGCAFLVTKL